MNAFCLWIRRALQARPLAIAIATIPVALAVVVLFAIAPTAAQAQGPTAATGCELIIVPSSQFNAAVPSGGEITIPFPPSGARVLCIDGLTGTESGAVEMSASTVFTATAGSSPVALTFVGGSIAAAVPVSATIPAYGIAFDNKSTVPSIKLVDSNGGISDARIFWGSLKAASTGRPQGALGSWREFKLSDTPTEIGWAKGAATEFRVRASEPMTLTIAGGTAFTVPALGTPICTRLGCALEVAGFAGDQTFKVTPSKGGWVSVEASGPAGSTIDLWVPVNAPAAVTTVKTGLKGGGGFPATRPYLPLLIR